MKTELEIKLAIVSETADRVADAIARADALGDFVLAHVPQVLIRDRYFDVDGRLGDRLAGLRLRTIDQLTLITVKSGDVSTSHGIRRNEYEAIWSEGSFDESLALLSELGVTVSSPPGFDAESDPSVVLEGLGLQEIQQRQTIRQLRHVAYASNREKRLAELAIDTVEYHFGGKTVRVRELEVERLGRGESAVLSRMAQELRDRWPELRLWGFSKVATGRAIERLLAERSVEDIADAAGDILPAAYELIERELGYQG